MKYVDRSPLQGPIPLERALTNGAQICDALDAAHRKGRDAVAVDGAPALPGRYGSSQVASAIANVYCI
jgi:hypothetical protein